MTEPTFWKFIEQSKEAKIYSNAATEQVILQVIILTEHLSELSKEELVSFELILRTKLKELYTGKIVELFVLVDNNIEKEDGEWKRPAVISDDQFLYFRCWLILQGEAVFKDVLANPELILKHDIDFSFTWGENLLYATEDAYKVHHENDNYSAIRNEAHKREPDLDYDFGYHTMPEKANYTTLEVRYPNLIAALV